jgi:hypothetical protein
MGHWYARVAVNLAMRFCIGLVAAIPFMPPAHADDALTASASANAEQVSAPVTFAGLIAPDGVKKFAGWVLNSGDNRGLPFVIIDKSDAKVFVFDKSGAILGTAGILIGLARGDDSIPGIGTMPLAKITPDMRTTPAGRFVATIGHNVSKSDVLWVDYPTALSLHRVINTNPSERRLERIASQAPADRRISYGCINVPAKFFDNVVNPAFKDTNGIVYILPEVKEIRAVFPNYYEGSDPARAAIN